MSTSSNRADRVHTRADHGAVTALVCPCAVMRDGAADTIRGHWSDVRTTLIETSDGPAQPRAPQAQEFAHG